MVLTRSGLIGSVEPTIAWAVIVEVGVGSARVDSAALAKATGCGSPLGSARSANTGAVCCNEASRMCPLIKFAHMSVALEC